MECYLFFMPCRLCYFWQVHLILALHYVHSFAFHWHSKKRYFMNKILKKYGCSVSQCYCSLFSISWWAVCATFILVAPFYLTNLFWQTHCCAKQKFDWPMLKTVRACRLIKNDQTSAWLASGLPLFKRKNEENKKHNKRYRLAVYANHSGKSTC